MALKSAVKALASGNGLVTVEPRKGTKETWKADDDLWYWRLRSGNGAIIATAAEGYTRKAHCIKMMDQVISGAYANVKAAEAT
jgi:uncharacterized protein YegP (UPF0339 family)